VLARIDPVQIQAQISQQQATIAESQSRLAQAQLTQNPTNVNVSTQIQQQVAGLVSARADDAQVRQNYNSQIASANAAVTDAQGRIDNANAAVANGEAGIRSAQANVNNAQIKYNRTYDLYKQGFVAAQDVDDAKTTLKVAEEATDVARGLLRSAQAARDSAIAQKASAQEQANIVVVKGKADIAAADARVEQARASLLYARSNTAQKPAYEQNLAALRSTVNANQAQLRNLQSQLSDTILTSPINGLVTARYVDPGAIVSPSQPVIAVQSNGDVFVDISVPEEVSNRLHVGQTGDVVFDGLPGRKFSGRITQITPAADPQSRQFPVRITLDNRGNLIKPGMFSRVSLVTQRVPGALVVPREAVQRSKDGAVVTVIDEKCVAHRRIVQTGAEDAAGIQIREGVRQKELVVTLTLTPIKDGQKVKITSIGNTPYVAAALTGGGGAPFTTPGGIGGGVGAPAEGGAQSGSAAGQVYVPNSGATQRTGLAGATAPAVSR
jgi:HlyD family secretion protein